MTTNSDFGNSVRAGATTSNTFTGSSQMDHEKPWWDNLLLHFENNNNNEPTKDHWVHKEIGTRNWIGEDQASDWREIFIKNGGWDLFNDDQILL